MCYSKEKRSCCGNPLSSGVKIIHLLHLVALVLYSLVAVAYLWVAEKRGEWISDEGNGMEYFLAWWVSANAVGCAVLWVPRLVAYCACKDGLYFVWYCTWILNLIVAVLYLILLAILLWLSRNDAQVSFTVYFIT